MNIGVTVCIVCGTDRQQRSDSDTFVDFGHKQI